jgi:hypothetical protein
MLPTLLRALRTAVGCLFLALFIQWALPAAPAAGQTAAGQMAAIAGNAERHLTLTIDAPGEEVDWGEAAAVTLVVTNPGAAAVEGEAMDEDQSVYTNGAMGIFEDHARTPYNANSYEDLVEARTGFLSDPRGNVKYDIWLEPNLPWGQEIGRAYLVGQIEMARSLIVDSAWFTTSVERWVP